VHRKSPVISCYDHNLIPYFVSVIRRNDNINGFNR
jgi:hypothetical protein